MLFRNYHPVHQKTFDNTKISLTLSQIFKKKKGILHSIFYLCSLHFLAFLVFVLLLNPSEFVSEMQIFFDADSFSVFFRCFALCEKIGRIFIEVSLVQCLLTEDFCRLGTR